MNDRITLTFKRPGVYKLRTMPMETRGITEVETMGPITFSPARGRSVARPTASGISNGPNGLFELIPTIHRSFTSHH